MDHISYIFVVNEKIRTKKVPKNNNNNNKYLSPDGVVAVDAVVGVQFVVVVVVLR